jgi:ribosomal protein L16 Arg81 hydroxylase
VPTTHGKEVPPPTSGGAEGSVDGHHPEQLLEEVGDIVGRHRYKLLMDMVPMMRQLLQEHVSPEHLKNILQTHVIFPKRSETEM